MDAIGRLDHGEAFNAAVAGLQRRFRAIERGAKDNNGNLTVDTFTHDIHGAIAEVFVAKTLGLYCNVASPNRAVADVGSNIEVRSTIKSDGPLIIRPRDYDDRRYYLVVGMYPDLKIVGWLTGKEAKCPEYWVDKDRSNQPINNPYWRIPQSVLHTDIFAY